MNGDDLITLAGALVATPFAGSEEARYRSSVSRSYYGVFHWAIAVLTDLGVDVPQNHTGHEMAKRRLRSSGNAHAMDAGSLLDDLRRDRNEADYDLTKKRFRAQGNAKVCVENALDAVNSLKQCLEEPIRSELVKRFQKD